MSCTMHVKKQIIRLFKGFRNINSNLFYKMGIHSPHVLQVFWSTIKYKDPVNLTFFRKKKQYYSTTLYSLKYP